MPRVFSFSESSHRVMVKQWGGGDDEGCERLWMECRTTGAVRVGGTLWERC